MAVLGFFKINAEKKRVHALEVSREFPKAERKRQKMYGRWLWSGGVEL